MFLCARYFIETLFVAGLSPSFLKVRTVLEIPSAVRGCGLSVSRCPVSSVQRAERDADALYNVHPGQQGLVGTAGRQQTGRQSQRADGRRRPRRTARRTQRGQSRVTDSGQARSVTCHGQRSVQIRSVRGQRSYCPVSVRIFFFCEPGTRFGLQSVIFVYALQDF